MSHNLMVDPGLALHLYRQMVLIRSFEDALFQQFLQGRLPGTLHQYQGQEAVAAGVCSTLKREDLIFSTHRPVGHAIAKGVPLERIAAELWGKATGCCGGKGGQMHLCDISVGMMPSNAIVGANIPIATGAALSFQLSGSDRVAVSFFGDGAANTGAFHEGLNLAAVKQAPVVFVCENNLYAASTHVSLAMRIEDIGERAKSYGIPGDTVDGMDPAAVYHAAAGAVSRARRGEGPTLIEYKTYRFMGHSRGDPGGYRTKEEILAWREKDPVRVFRERLLADYGQEEQALDHIQQECQDQVQQAIDYAIESPEPELAEALTNVYTPAEAAR
jgi:acetoin:2,6-dichlorophenolindophenol oxidoreductase subunit alpha